MEQEIPRLLDTRGKITGQQVVDAIKAQHGFEVSIRQAQRAIRSLKGLDTPEAKNNSAVGDVVGAAGMGPQDVDGHADEDMGQLQPHYLQPQLQPHVHAHPMSLPLQNPMDLPQRSAFVLQTPTGELIHGDAREIMELLSRATESGMA